MKTFKTIEGIEFYISDSDEEKITQRKWIYSKGYIIMEKGQVSLQVYLLGRDKNKVIDHIDRNPKNNQRENLKFVTRSENCLNSKRQGNHISKNRGKYLVKITRNSITHFLGRYDSLSQATLVRNLWITQHI